MFMQWNKLALTFLLCANFAHAEIAVVDEFPKSESIHTAKVISKQPFYSEMIQTVPKNVCYNLKNSTHYDKRGSIDIVYRDRMLCRTEYIREKFQVLRGYSVSYEYNGKYFSAVLDHDPGEYVSVHSGK